MSEQGASASVSGGARAEWQSHGPELLDLAMVLLAALVTLSVAVLNPQYAGIAACSCAVATAPMRRGIWYLDPVLAFALPWLVVLLSTLVDLSVYSRPVGSATFSLITACVLAWWCGVSVAALLSSAIRHRHSAYQQRFGLRLPRVVRPQYLLVLLVLTAFVVLTVAQVAVSGFIPLIEGLRGGTTRYLAFGIPTVYGLYLALANVVAIAALYRFAVTNRSRHLSLLVLVLLVFLLFVTRQNVLTVAFAGLAIWSLVRKRLSTSLITAVGVAALLGFAAFGEFRSGDIRQIAGVRADAPPLPSALVWVYSYGFFNILNLDNVVERGGGPHFDGSSFSSLVPTVFRQPPSHPRLLDRPQFTVRSYLAELHLDVGPGGAILFTIAVALLTGLAYRHALHRPTLRSTGAYGVLYFCAVFAFFTNFWFYLPVVSQLALIGLLGPAFEVTERPQRGSDQ